MYLQPAPQNPAATRARRTPLAAGSEVGHLVYSAFGHEGLHSKGGLLWASES